MCWRRRCRSIFGFNQRSRLCQRYWRFTTPMAAAFSCGKSAEPVIGRYGCGMESGKASLAKAILWGQQFVPLGLGPESLRAALRLFVVLLRKQPQQPDFLARCRRLYHPGFLMLFLAIQPALFAHLFITAFTSSSLANSPASASSIAR